MQANNLINAGIAPQTALAVQGVPSAGFVAITQAGSNQSAATLVPHGTAKVRLPSAAAGGVRLSTLSAGDEVLMMNFSGNTTSVYPPTGGAIANGSANAAFSVASNKTAWFICLDGSNFAAVLSA